jgi:hypothetical protein
MLRLKECIPPSGSVAERNVGDNGGFTVTVTDVNSRPCTRAKLRLIKIGPYGRAASAAAVTC